MADYDTLAPEKLTLIKMCVNVSIEVKKMAEKKTQPSLEKSLQELEKLVDKMEKGDLDLDQSMKLFEQGIGLVKQCQKTLGKAEQKVQTLIDSTDGKLLIDFEEDE